MRAVSLPCHRLEQCGACYTAHPPSCIHSTWHCSASDLRGVQGGSLKWRGRTSPYSRHKAAMAWALYHCVPCLLVQLRSAEKLAAPILNDGKSLGTEIVYVSEQFVGFTPCLGSPRRQLQHVDCLPRSGFRQQHRRTSSVTILISR